MQEALGNDGAWPGSQGAAVPAQALQAPPSRRRWPALGALAVSLCLPLIAPAASSASGLGAISGTAVAASGKAPVPSLEVCATRPSEQFPAAGCTVTNSKGEYSISLQPGAYKVEFTNRACSEGCKTLDLVPQWYDGAPGGSSSFATAESVAVSEGTPTGGISAELATGGQIQGSVTAAAGLKEALDGIEVCAYDLSAEGAESCTNTSKTGTYALVGLGTGSYAVEFENTDCPEGGSCQTVNYIPQFYDDKATLAEATPLPVKAGSIVSEIGAALLSGGKIEGVVTALAGGAPVASVEVCALTPLDTIAVCTYANAHGEYALVGLGSGKYKVFFNNLACQDEVECRTLDYVPQYYDDRSTFAAGGEVEATAGSSVGDVDAALASGGEITGTVTQAPSGAPVEGIEVCAEATEGLIESCAETGADGSYTLVGLNGTYRVVFVGTVACPHGACSETHDIVEYWNEQFTSATANVVSVAAPGVVAGIDARLVESVAQLEGEVAAARLHEEELAAARRHEEEAAAARRQEEAAAVKKREEAIAAAKKALEELERRASVKIERVKVSAKSLSVTLRVAEPGVVTLSGPGVRRRSLQLTAGTHTVKLTLTSNGRKARLARRRIKLTAAEKVGSRAVAASKLVRL